MAAVVGTQAVDRASAVLIAVLGSTEPVTFADLIARTELPKSTLSRLTTSLERNGLLQRTASGRLAARRGHHRLRPIGPSGG